MACTNRRRWSRLATGLRRSIALSFATPVLRRLLLTWALWVVVEWATLVVLSITALRRGGVADVALLGVLRLVPAAAMAAPAARLCERLPRGKLVGGVELLSAVLLVGLAATVSLPFGWPSDLLVVLMSVASTVLRPSLSALVPELVHDPARLAAVNSTYGLVEASASLLGPMTASTLLALSSAPATLLILAILLGGGAIAAAGITSHRQPPVRRSSPGIGQGLTAWLSVPALRSVYLVFLVQTLVRGILNVLVVVWADRLLGRSSDAGLLFAAAGLGGLIGALVAHAGVGWPAGPVFALGMAGWGLPLLLWAVVPGGATAFGAMVAIGAANAIASAFGYTIVHRVVPDATLGRAFAVFWASVWTATAIGSYAAYGLVAAVGLSSSFAIAGAVLVLAALASWPSVRSADATLGVPVQDVRLLARAPMLAALGQVALEQLVRHARRVTVSAGDRVTEQGEVADDVYVIESGRLQALVDGVPTTVMGAGVCFGEIAALRNTQRTATVRAVVDSRLLVIDGTAFVLAVTGHRGAERAAEDLVRSRLAVGVGRR